MSGQETELGTLINQYPPEQYGSAEISRTEFTALKGLYTSLRDQMYGEENLTSEQRTGVREAVLESITDDGWPQLKKLSESDLAETAVYHACVVAEKLHKERGPEALPDTVWAYTAKNQFDRFVFKTLSRAGKLSTGSKLGSEWNKPKERRVSKSDDITKYPVEVDSSKIHGIGKVERYWPAQLMRYLESIRLGKASDSELQKYKVGDTPRVSYKIPWFNYDEVIKNAESIEDISVGVAIKTLEILKTNGLDDEQLIAVLLAGYSPGGPISEHGNIPEIESIWKRIVEETKNHPSLGTLQPRLTETISKRLRDLNYPIIF
jgi:hypothetical protein